MRRFLLLFAAFAASVSVWADPVSRAEAQSNARAYLASKGKTLNEKATPYKAPRKGSRVTEEKAYYYVFSAGENDGYVIVSGDDRTEQVLGYVDEGNFDAENLPINMKNWLQYYADAIQHLDDNNITLPTRKGIAPRRAATTRHSVPVLLQSRWNQGFPYNKKCPEYYKEDGTTGRAVTGCTATAVAQIINFYKHPAKLKAPIPSHSNTYTLKDGSTRTVTVPVIARNTPLHWENMCDVYTGQETDAQNDAVAELMLYVGSMVTAGYGASTGAVHNKNVSEGLCKYFGFDDQAWVADRYNYSADEWDDLLYSELSAGHPMSYQGFSSGGGHAFCIDGYDGQGLFHVNWGWGGGSDGWFIISILNPGDNSGIGASSSSDGYSRWQNAIIGVRLPDNVKAEPKTCLTINDTGISGTSITSKYINWTGNSNTFHAGIVELQEDGTTKIVSTRSDFELSANYSKTLTFNMKGRLKDGVHILSPASKISTNKTYCPLYDMRRNYIEATVENGEMTLRMVTPQPQVEVANINFPGNRIVGKNQEVRVQFKNAGDECFEHFTLIASKGDDPRNAEIEKATSAVLVRAQDSIVVSFYFKPEETGTYNVWISQDEGGNNILGHAQMQSITEAEAVQPNLSVTSITIQNMNGGTIYGNYLEGKISVKNNMKTAYNGRVRLASWTQDYNTNTAYSSKAQYVEVSVEAGRTVSVPFIFEDLRTDTRYRMVIQDATTGKDFDKGGLWDHIWNMNPGIVAWKADGTRVVSAPTATSTATTWCSLYIDGLKSGNLRASTTNKNVIYAYTTRLTPSARLEGSNVVWGNTAEQINLVSDTAYVVPVSFTAEQASFQYICKEEKVQKWSCFTLPFMPYSIFIDGVRVELNGEDTPFRIYEFAQESDDMLPVFEPATELRGNTAYLITYNADMVDRAIEFKASNANFTREGEDKKVVSSPNYRFYGTSYAPKLKDVYMLNAEGTAFEYVSTSTALPAMGGYFTTTRSADDSPLVLPICEAPVITAIDGVAANAIRLADHNIYTLDGRVLPPNARLQRGIYLYQGKKVLVK